MGYWSDRKLRENAARINKVGSSDNPPPERTPLGTLIEDEPEWECCCCDQHIPRPSRGYSTAVGSFCGDCFLAFLKHLFNGAKPEFLNAIRDESYRFISERREDLENGVVPLPKPSPVTLGDIVEGRVEQARLRRLKEDECSK